MTPTCYAHDTQNGVIPMFCTITPMRPHGFRRQTRYDGVNQFKQLPNRS